MTDKMTAVEWLLNELPHLKDIELITPILEQAKAMEKEQIQKAYDDGVEDTCEMFYQMSKS